MQRERSRIAVLTCLTLIATLPLGGGCATNTPPAGEAPEIPPVSTFVIDFGDFSGGGTGKSRDGSFDPTTAQAIPGSHWGFAALNVAVWNTIITVTLAIPVAAFVESFNHEPVQQADGSWMWSYEVTVAGVVYTAVLTARTSGPNVAWEMLLSKEGEYADFEWFTGLSNLVGTEGTWQLNLNPNDPTPLVGIEWHRSLTDETADIQYTNIVPDGPENGGYIFYAIVDGAFDAAYDIFNKGADNLTSIEWNRTTRDGRVMDEANFGDADWHCWDGNLQNADCP